MNEPRVTLELTDAAAGAPIRNLWPLYVHDLVPHTGQRPNGHGVLIDDPRVTDLSAQGETLRSWWGTPGSLFPYLIVVDSAPAGFALIAAPPSLPAGFDADFIVHEFFALHPFRGRGIAERAALDGFARHRGRWEVVTDPTNARAIAFWRRVIGVASEGACEEEECDHHWGRKVVFRFSNG